jgi:hypothetical protein
MLKISPKKVIFKEIFLGEGKYGIFKNSLFVKMKISKINKSFDKHVLELTVDNRHFVFEKKRMHVIPILCIFDNWKTGPHHKLPSTCLNYFNVF